MAIDSKHPAYLNCIADWLMLRDIMAGERTVKDKGVEYLPATGGMVADGQGTAGLAGEQAYQAYKTRAVFHDFYADTVRRAVGVLHRKPAVIELPESLEYLRERATPNGEPLSTLLRKINRAQLQPGRMGLLAEVPEEESRADDSLYIATYSAETIINWQDGTAQPGRPASLELVVLDETGDVMDPETFNWQEETQYRVLRMLDDVYQFGVFKKGDAYNEEAMVPVELKGAKADDIPFEFVNPTDIISGPDTPTLLGLARLCLAIYRGEADYRQSLFNQGQDTLVTIGELMESGSVDPESDEGPVRVGAGARISMQLEGDAKYIGVDSVGLEEQRKALENDKRQAEEQSSSLLESRSPESGEALKERKEGRTATLTDIAFTGAGALEAILKKIAIWKGADPDKVSVTPNTDFAEDELSGKEMLDWQQGKNQGLPISQKALHGYMVKREVTEMTFEEEMQAIADEDPIDGTGAGGDGTTNDED